MEDFIQPLWRTHKSVFSNHRMKIISRSPFVIIFQCLDTIFFKDCLSCMQVYESLGVFFDPVVWESIYRPLNRTIDGYLLNIVGFYLLTITNVSSTEVSLLCDSVIIFALIHYSFKEF